LRVVALDAAMPFDYEHKATQSLKKQRALNIAIVGFGTFGQFLAKRLIAAGHNVSFLCPPPPPPPLGSGNLPNCLLLPAVTSGVVLAA